MTIFSLNLETAIISVSMKNHSDPVIYKLPIIENASEKKMQIVFTVLHILMFVGV